VFIDQYCPCDAFGCGDRRTDLRAGEVVDAPSPGARAVARTGRASPTRDLYREFIEEAAKCYVHALQHEGPDVPALGSLYAKIDRMHVLSSLTIIDIADGIARKIIDTYQEPDKSFVELREMISTGSVNLIREFSIACRAEFRSPQIRPF
jgi:hypothetical protein